MPSRQEMLLLNRLFICAILATVTTALSPLKSDSASRYSYKIGRGGLASIFTAAYYMSIEIMKIPVSEASLSSPVFNMIYLRELDRLKENYPSNEDESLHQIIVAKNDEDEVVGYIDIDRRQTFAWRFPLPYISDLVVQPSWRNRGVATSLLQYCSDVVCKSEWMENRVNLLVETDNERALSLYNRLHFWPVHAETGPMDDSSMIKTIPINLFDEDVKNIKLLDSAPASVSIDTHTSSELLRNSNHIALSYLLKENALKQYDRILLRKYLFDET